MKFLKAIQVEEFKRVLNSIPQIISEDTFIRVTMFLTHY